jgi:hypothetical protein
MLGLGAYGFTSSDAGALGAGFTWIFEGLVTGALLGFTCSASAGVPVPGFTCGFTCGCSSLAGTEGLVCGLTTGLETSSLAGVFMAGFTGAMSEDGTGLTTLLPEGAAVAGTWPVCTALL